MSNHATTNSDHAGTVLAIAVRPAEGAAMREVDSAEATVDGGLVGDHGGKGDRGLTLLSVRQWEEAQQVVEGAMPWHTRRANVLIDCGSMADWIGRTVRIGGVTVAIRNETKPCDLMDRQQPGLRAALRPECRGGVCGRIVRGGSIHVGDAVFVDLHESRTA